MATYTTTDAIMRRLKGRLELIAPSAFGRTQVDLEFLKQLQTQATARLEGVLKRVYNMPLLSTTHPFLAEYVELRVCCQIIPTYYQGESVSDDRGIGSRFCKDAETLLKDLLEGIIALDGETRIPSQTPATLRNTGRTIVGRYADSELGAIKW